MPVTAEKPAPYAPPTAVLDLIDRYRNRGMQTPMTGEVLGRAGVSESLIPRTFQALQTLDLIDETGKPTPTFEAIRLAPEGEYKKRLEEWLKGAYADVFGFVDPSVDDDTRIRDAFRTYQPVGQQGRMVTLFQGLCAAAGLAPDKALQPRPATSNRPAASAVKRPIKILPKPPAKPTPSASSAMGLPAALTGLLASLPRDGGGWTQDKREKFMTTFGAVLDFCYPIVESEPAIQEAEEQSHE
ncbi:MAG: hypothetical protein EKK36_11455 [Bradyrhizobiaceae bacterium]|nr:MAG: hypothetical protein EKK36_11455 [Bradyrhizobiaceae bacterium]